MDLDPHQDPRVRLFQLRAFKAAYEHLTHAPPQLPEPGSPLPALLAVRSVQQLNSELKESVQPTYESLKRLRETLAQERTDLSDAALLTEALKTRLARLESQASEPAEPSQDELAHTLTAAEQTKGKHYAHEKKRLVRALNKFLNDTLAPMLAAEELGGPVAGSTAAITEDALIAGFTAKGRPKKAKKADADGEDRQLRIDQIWGGRDLDDSEFEDSPQTESAAAAREMRALVEELLNDVVEHGTNAYRILERDSAAARFLVRAKIAMLHPKDARKIRLLDFGRELDD